MKILEQKERDLAEIEIKFGDELPTEVLTTIQLISKKWSLPVLYSLHEKNMGFSELKAELGQNISSNMLSRALDELHNLQLVEKRTLSESPLRFEYSTTVLGKDLCDLCQIIGAFGKKYLSETKEVN